eukprot:SAG31_NODE_2720_length_5190_cov_3.678256_2_plen_94_part_00
MHKTFERLLAVGEAASAAQQGEERRQTEIAAMRKEWSHGQSWPSPMLALTSTSGQRTCRAVIAVRVVGNRICGGCICCSLQEEPQGAVLENGA